MFMSALIELEPGFIPLRVRRTYPTRRSEGAWTTTDGRFHLFHLKWPGGPSSGWRICPTHLGAKSQRELLLKHSLEDVEFPTLREALARLNDALRLDWESGRTE